MANYAANARTNAFFIEVGMEKMRHLGGIAVAVNKTGDTRRVDLDDILDLARELVPANTPVDHASY